MEPRFQIATARDIPLVLPLMLEFYVFEEIPFDEHRNSLLLTQLSNDPRCGRLVLIYAGEHLAGYFVVGFGFSVEFGGRDALLDELFIIEKFRGRGYGTRAIEFAIALCADEKIAALHLEADHFNDRAHELYLRLGFKDHRRHLMTKWLS